MKIKVVHQNKNGHPTCETTAVSVRNPTYVLVGVPDPARKWKTIKKWPNYTILPHDYLAIVSHYQGIILVAKIQVLN